VISIGAYDGHVCAAEVVVDGADHADDVEVSVLVSLLLRHLVLLLQLLHRVILYSATAKA
jgi:hypothetical protein